MTGFSAEWLALREAADHEARDQTLVEHLVAWRQATGPIEVADLGAGAGSNLRYLAPRLSGSQSWRLYDRDRRLLETALDHTEAWAGRLELACRRDGDQLWISGGGLDLQVACVPLGLADRLAELELPNEGLVTAAALLDLVSEPWLAHLARRCGERRSAFHAALSYDGNIECRPANDADHLIRRLVNRHQVGDKGFGPALGPTAAEVAARLFRDQGYQVKTAASDWTLDAGQSSLQAQLLGGWAAAAMEIAPERMSEIRAWQRRRISGLAQTGARLVVGHQDVLATL